MYSRSLCFFTLLLSLAGCITKGRMVKDPEPVYVEYRSEGAFRDSKICVIASENIARFFDRFSNSVFEKSFADEAVGKLSKRIMKEDFFNLPEKFSENKWLGGKDFPVVSIFYRSGGKTHLIVRDYRNSAKFERQFHRIENLFHELAIDLRKP